jgi:hypothetical protein
MKTPTRRLNSLARGEIPHMTKLANSVVSFALGVSILSERGT